MKKVHPPLSGGFPLTWNVHFSRIRGKIPWSECNLTNTNFISLFLDFCNVQLSENVDLRKELENDITKHLQSQIWTKLSEFAQKEIISFQQLMKIFKALKMQRQNLHLIIILLMSTIFTPTFGIALLLVTCLLCTLIFFAIEQSDQISSVQWAFYEICLSSLAEHVNAHAVDIDRWLDDEALQPSCLLVNTSHHFVSSISCTEMSIFVP